MLESMVNKLQPSRAEVSDITNAVLDGCDSVLLTGETAYGPNPVLALEYCRRIIVQAEKIYKFDVKCERIFKQMNYL